MRAPRAAHTTAGAPRRPPTCLTSPTKIVLKCFKDYFCQIAWRRDAGDGRRGRGRGAHGWSAMATMRSSGRIVGWTRCCCGTGGSPLGPHGCSGGGASHPRRIAAIVAHMLSTLRAYSAARRGSAGPGGRGASGCSALE